jgi:hypothetical protein
MACLIFPWSSKFRACAASRPAGSGGELWEQAREAASRAPQPAPSQRRAKPVLDLLILRVRLIEAGSPAAPANFLARGKAMGHAVARVSGPALPGGSKAPEVSIGEFGTAFKLVAQPIRSQFAAKPGGDAAANLNHRE